MWKLIGLLVLLPAAASAATRNLAASLDDIQETTCGIGSTARGTATATLDDVSGAFSWSVTFGNNAPNYNDSLLNGNQPDTLAHFHGPAAPGATAGVQVNIGPAEPKVGNTVLTAPQIADVKADLWYVNIHSAACPGGEIRGQLLLLPKVPSAAPWAIAISLLVVGVAAGRRALRRRAAT